MKETSTKWAKGTPLKEWISRVMTPNEVTTARVFLLWGIFLGILMGILIAVEFVLIQSL